MDSNYKSIHEKSPSSVKPSGKKWQWRFAIHILCLLWLGPIITLLYLNFSQHIIGPSLWCHLGRCNVYDEYGQYLVGQASRNDRRDHNVNGSLLFVAKGLEVWFTFVAGCLVYEAQKVLRESNDGLPSNYSLMHLEFSDLLTLFEISKWTQPIRDARRSSNRRQLSKLCAFVLLACIMMVLVNLMGPATGILILPSVQSIDLRHNASELFIQMQSHNPPAADSGPGLVGCNATQLQNHAYSCAEYVRGSELDSMTSFVAAPSRTIERTTNDTVGMLYLAESQELNVEFLAFNYSHIGKNDSRKYFNSFIVPNRQTLRMVSADLQAVINHTDIMNYSMQVSSQRNGPGILVSGLNINIGSVKSIRLGENKSITCLNDWTTDQVNDTLNYTKCIRNGTGWNSVNKQASFSIGNLSEPNAGAEADRPKVLIYFSDKATYYGGDLERDPQDVACLTGNLSAACDWDNIFLRDKVNGSHFDGGFSNTTIVEWSFPGNSDNESDVSSDGRIWFEYVSHLHFGLYSVDLSFGDETYMAHLESEENKPGDELVVDPLWTLAAWSVDVDGIVDAARFPNLLPAGSDYISDIMDTEEKRFEYYSLNLFAIVQTMSLISYESIELNGSTSYGRNKDNVFYNWVTRRVWAYGISTRTSKLGVVVVCAGMATIVFRVFFALYRYRHKNNFVQLAASP